MSHSFSYSQLSQAYRCNQLFKYLYVDKLTPEGPHSADLAFGSSIHFALESLLLHKENPEVAFETYWESQTKTNLEYGKYNQGSLQDMGKIFVSRFERLHAKKINLYQMEQRLFGSIGSIRIEGTPDIIGEFEGIPSVIDFKTSGYRYPKERCRLSEQMYLYAELARQASQYEAKQLVYIVFIKCTTPTIQILKHMIDKPFMNLMLDNIYNQCLNLEDMIQNKTITRNPASCIMGDRKCHFFDKCWEAK